MPSISSKKGEKPTEVGQSTSPKDRTPAPQFLRAHINRPRQGDEFRMNSAKNRKQLTHVNPSEISNRGLRSLAFIKQTEKLTTSASCKLYPSLAVWVRKPGGSTFLRKLVEKAKHEEEKLLR